MIFSSETFAHAWGILKLPHNGVAEHNAQTHLNAIIHAALQKLAPLSTPKDAPPYASVYPSALKVRGGIPISATSLSMVARFSGEAVIVHFEDRYGNGSLKGASGVTGPAERAPLLICISSMLAINHVCRTRE